MTSGVIARCRKENTTPANCYSFYPARVSWRCMPASAASTIASPGVCPRSFSPCTPTLIGDPQDLAGRPGPVWDHVIVCDKGHPISFRTLGAGVKINRFPNTAAVCRKDRLWANYTAMQKKHGKKSFNFIPKVISFNISLELCNPPCGLTNFPRRKRFSSGK